MNSQQSVAGLIRRFLATLIDMILVPLLALLIMLVTGVLEHAEDYAGYRPLITILLLGLASYLCLNGWLLWQRGQTVGKAALGIAIVLVPDGGKVALWRLICIRALFFPLLYLILIPWLFFMPLLDQIFIFSKKRRCLHDYASGTLVVRVETRQQNAVS